MVTDSQKNSDWRNRLLRLEDHYNPPEAMVTREGCPVVIRRELTLLTGVQKTFKTHIHQLITGVVLGEEGNKMFTATRRGMKIVILDTEQNPDRLHDQYAALMGSIGLPRDKTPDNLIIYYLLGKPPEEMRNCLDGSIELHKPDIVVVDGVADMVEEINDYGQCNTFVRHIMDLAFNNECGIILVLHQNPNSNKERGHLGTILSNKTSGYIGLSRDKDVVTVSSAGRSRGAAFNQFKVKYDPESDTVVEVNSALSVPSFGAEKNKKEQDYINAIPSFFEKDPFGNLKPLRAKDIEEKLVLKFKIDPKNRNSITRAIRKAKEEKLIRQERPRGEYYLEEPIITEKE